MIFTIVDVSLMFLIFLFVVLKIEPGAMCALINTVTELNAYSQIFEIKFDWTSEPIFMYYWTNTIWPVADFMPEMVQGILIWGKNVLDYQKCDCMQCMILTALSTIE